MPTTGIQPGRRVEVDFMKLAFKALPTFFRFVGSTWQTLTPSGFGLRRSGMLVDGTQTQRDAGRQKRKIGQNLRERDPW